MEDPNVALFEEFKASLLSVQKAYLDLAEVSLLAPVDKATEEKLTAAADALELQSAEFQKLHAKVVQTMAHRWLDFYHEGS